MTIKEDILVFLEQKKRSTSLELAQKFGVSKQYVARFLKELADEKRVVKIGSTRNAFYILPKFIDEVGAIRTKRRLRNSELKEHEIMEDVLASFPPFQQAPENVQSILRYTFSEMLNNAIEHSESGTIEVEMLYDGQFIRFIVNDFGVGAFRNIMHKRHLQSELEAMQDVLKGKTTTDPQAHSGEGIFFTSKSGDRFVLESFGRRLVVDNQIQDVFFEEQKPVKRGTRVILSIDRASKRHLNDVFRKFQSDPDSYAFDRTEIHVRLFTMGTIYVSRSQARRILAGLDKFKKVILDFDRVPNVGQAFADEIFRVFKIKYPNITISPVNMNEAVRFMIERVEDVNG
jgi:anti-sigma regulatory factor (Ser/Thr protein kinase)